MLVIFYIYFGAFADQIIYYFNIAFAGGQKIWSCVHHGTVLTAYFISKQEFINAIDTRIIDGVYYRMKTHPVRSDDYCLWRSYGVALII